MVFGSSPKILSGLRVFGLPPLRSGQFRLTIPNTYSTLTVPASLCSDGCSPSLRNAVRLHTGIGVHLHRNTHLMVIRSLAGVPGWHSSVIQEGFFWGYAGKRELLLRPPPPLADGSVVRGAGHECNGDFSPVI